MTLPKKTVKKTNIYLPIESALRETYPKSFLAAYLAQKGYRVAILPDYLLPRLPFSEGIVLGKNHVHFNQWQRKSKSQSTFILLEEEGAHAFGNNDKRSSLVYGRLRYVLNIAHTLTAWGLWQANIAKAFTTLPIIVTGTLYMEVCKPKYSRNLSSFDNDITKGLKDYILVNTRFGFANCNYPPISSLTGTNPDFEYDLEKPYFWRELAANDMLMLGSFISMITSIADRFPDKQIVIRPHPVENVDFYIELFADKKNVFVSNSGYVLSWLRNAACIITNACTTSLQSEVARKPVINFIPNGHNSYDMKLFDDIGFTARNETEVFDAIESVYRNKLERFRIGQWTDEECTFSLHTDFMESILSIVDSISPSHEPRHNMLPRIFPEALSYAMINYVKKLFERENGQEISNIRRYVEAASLCFNSDLDLSEPIKDCFVVESSVK